MAWWKLTGMIAIAVGCAHSSAPSTTNDRRARPVDAATPSASATSSASVPTPTRATPTPKPPFLFVRGSSLAFFADYTMAEFHTPDVSPAYLSRDEPRVAILHRYVLVEAPESGGFYYRDLGEYGSAEGGRVTSLTSEARKDILVDYEITTGMPNSFDHYVTEVWSYGSSGPEILFTHETGLHRCCGDGMPFYRNDYDIAPKTFTLHSSTSYRPGGPKDWRDATLEGIPPAIAPWERRKETWRWDGAHFVRD